MNSSANLSSKPSAPAPSEVPTFRLTNEKLNDTTLVCDALRIRYRVAKESGVIRVYRRSEASQQEVLVAEWWQRSIRKDTFRFPQQSGLVSQGVPSSRFIPKTGGHRGTSTL